MDSQIYGQNFQQAGKTIQWGKDSLFSKWRWKNWTATCRKMTLGHCLRPYTNMNSKWMKGLNVRQETIKTPEEKVGSNFFDLGHSNFLLDMSPKARDIKAKEN